MRLPLRSPSACSLHYTYLSKRAHRPSITRVYLSLYCRWQSTGATEQLNSKEIDLSKYPVTNIRNFSIIAHIDHGKSTLADRLLEITGTIKKHASNKQVLDKLRVERERGITVKAQTVSMFYNHNGKEYLLNLIDTPGHVDFSYEVSRSLAACQGTLLLVDAAQGIQAQTVANFYLAFGEGLHIIPVINKIDLDGADPDRVKNQIQRTFDLNTTDIMMISAKTGLNISEILPKIIEHTPPPSGSPIKPLRALLFDSWYDQYVGVVCLMALDDGILRKGDRITSAHSGLKYEVMEVGIMYPEQYPTGYLQAGQVGYVVCNMKAAAEAHIGDTFYHVGQKVEPFVGFEPAKSMVFAGIFPTDPQEFDKLEQSITKLTLTDASVAVQKESSMALGQGFRLGFLGTLHMDVFRQRLEQDYEANIIVTAPTVPFKVLYKNGTEKIIHNPSEFPEPAQMSLSVADLLEPMVSATIIVPTDSMGSMMDLCNSRRGEQLEHTYIDEQRALLRYRLPLAEIVTDFYDELKSRSAGYASFDYEDAGYQSSDLVRMTCLINYKPVDALSVILHRSTVQMVGRDWVRRLKTVIPKQLFEVAVQAAVGGKVVARETISAMRKNVTAKCYGGDISRKMKLLEKQKEGKKRMKLIGNVELPQAAFYDFMGKKTE